MLIHNADITGSLLVNGTGYNTGSFSGSFTGAVAGTTATASYVEYNNVANKPALVSGSSQITYSGLTGIPSGIVSGSAQVAGFGIFATTGSNQFNGSQAITGSLTTTGTIVAQTLNVQQVTSSIVYSSGSNIFGNSVSNTQQFTGSLQVSGSSHNILGNVGIGPTGTPSSELQVGKASDVTIAMSNSSSVTSGARGSLAWYNSSVSTVAIIRAAAVTDNVGTELQFFTRPAAGSLTQRLTLDSAGNLGVGTASPESLSNNTTLQIDGTNHSFVRTGTSNYGGYFATIPTADVLCIANVRNPVTGTYSNTGKAASGINLFSESSNGYITFLTTATNNSSPGERMRITSNGRVGIGTDTPGANLHVVRANDGGSGTPGVILRTDNGANDIVRFQDGTTIVAVVKNDGSIGIGTGTSSLEARLDLRGTGNTALNSRGNLFVSDGGTATQTAEEGGQISFGAWLNGDLTKPYPLAAIKGVSESSTVNINNGALIFGTMSTATTVVERMRITSTGNVGIGTASPNIYNLTNTRNLTLVNDAGYGVIAAVGSSGNGGEIDLGNSSIRHAAIASLDGSNLGFYTNGSNSGTGVTERMRITSGGGVSLKGPFLSMDAAGLGSSPAGLGYGLFPYSGIGLGISSVVGMRFLTGTTPTDRMSIDSSGNIGAPTGTNIYNASDSRLKQNIEAISNGLDKISALNPVKFNWVDGFVPSEDGKDMLGFVAQEVYEVIPEAVENFGNNSIIVNDIEIENPLRVNEKFIIPVLVKAIQEQQSQIEILKAEIQTLKQQ